VSVVADTPSKPETEASSARGNSNRHFSAGAFVALDPFADGISRSKQDTRAVSTRSLSAASSRERSVSRAARTSKTSDSPICLTSMPAKGGSVMTCPKDARMPTHTAHVGAGLRERGVVRPREGIIDGPSRSATPNQRCR
jgi:hypothetical protein